MNDRRAFAPSLLATVLLTAVCVVHLTAGPAPQRDCPRVEIAQRRFAGAIPAGIGALR